MDLITKIVLFNFADPDRLHPFTILVVSDNGRFAATANTGGSVHLYNIKDGQVHLTHLLESPVLHSSINI